MIQVGLRVDVDTLRGTRIGVPNLIAVLARHDIRASFFFSVGPDNMGRHLWRLLRPAFMLKMLRTRAARLYGWDILARGTVVPGPVIGRRCPDPIRDAAAAGHDVGLHAWDHHGWQTHVGRLGEDAVTAQIRRGYDLLGDILGSPPECFAAPAWRITPVALRALEQFSFRFQSDCRGRSLFRPVVGGQPLSHVEVPTTLPTYDEVIGSQCTADTYNDYMLGLIDPNRLNVLTIHAEVEGIACLGLFRDFLERGTQRDIVFEPLGDLVSRHADIGASGIHRSTVAGREGWVACQDPAAAPSSTREAAEQ